MHDDRFNPQPTLTSEKLLLRPLKADDVDGLFAAARDPLTWAGHPTKDRYQPEVFEPYFRFLLGTETTLVIIDQPSNSVIGCSRYYVAPDRPEDISIGFTFLDHVWWGGATNFELKRLMLDHAFTVFDMVWFHIGPTNIRSQRGTAKLGARYEYDAVLDLTGKPVLWMCFCLERQIWEEVKNQHDL